MQQYPKTYEDVFTSDRIAKKCNIDKVTPTTESIEKAEYLNLFKSAVKDSQLVLFDQWIKIYWLLINFSYNGISRNSLGVTNKSTDAAISIFCRNHMNFSQKLFTHSFYFNKISTYFTEIFPDYINVNPFKVKCDFPFSYVTLDCMVLVYQLPERMELLQWAENKKMMYIEFLDYVINYILCRNEDLGTEEYTIKINKGFPPYIRYEQYLQNRASKKRRRRNKKPNNLLAT